MKKVFKMQDLDCANCAAKMEAAIAKINGVQKAAVNFMTQKMMIECEDGRDVSAVMQKVRKACKKVEPDCRIIL